MWLLLVSTAITMSWGQDNPKPASSATGAEKSATSHLNASETLYLQLRTIGLSQNRVFRLRDVSIDRAPIHITLNDGIIAFTEDVSGQVTGAFFEGDGEILLSPPNQYERASMALFTGGAILEERFETAYFRFNDETFKELRPSLVPADDAPAFVTQWNETARNLAENDGLRLFMTLSKFLPSVEQPAENAAGPGRTGNQPDQFLHIRLQGVRLGTFDVFFDSEAQEQVWAGQSKTVDGESYYDVWTSFASIGTKGNTDALNATVGEGGRSDSIATPHYKIRATIRPPTQVDAEAILQLEVRQGGQRTIAFELSRSLQVTEVEADGHPVEFIHNPAMEGTQRARRGNDLVAIVFPQPLRTGQKVELRFVYGGEVLSEAGTGLLYVGARGTWYPNRGLVMSSFDLEFHYPVGWTLIATGKRNDRISSDLEGPESRPLPPGQQASRWVSERPVPVAGFDLGKYERAVAHAGDITVETYATSGVERGFPKPEGEDSNPASPVPGVFRVSPAIAPLVPSPARNAQSVAAASARAIDFYSRRYGPFPYGELKLAQMPGNVSQGWPGLVFLSSMSFLTGEEKSQLHLTPVEKTLINQTIAHETAHQWWGDLVMWSGYRDQWIVEALANYSAMMVLESENPAQFRAAMEKFRDDLLVKNKSGTSLMEDGPVTLGTRLSCSQFPDGYDAISYGRGTWLFHMLRFMLRDAEKTSGTAPGADEPFVRVLRRIRDRYQGKPITTRELLQAFEEELPPSLWYEHHKSLNWFYEGWVNGTAIPRYEVHAVKYADKPGSTTISGVIVQKEAPENLVTSVPVHAQVEGKTVLLGRVFADGPETPFHLNAPAGARKVVLDVDQTLLARTR
jgi:hypothetical protein